jgi:hypothetical protein
VCFCFEIDGTHCTKRSGEKVDLYSKFYASPGRPLLPKKGALVITHPPRSRLDQDPSPRARRASRNHYQSCCDIAAPVDRCQAVLT